RPAVADRDRSRTMFLRSIDCKRSCPSRRRQTRTPPPCRNCLAANTGEMSTLGNYMFQSFNFRSKSKLRPFYNLVAAITAEELGHVELVSNGVAMLANGPDSEGDETGGADITGAP